MPDEKIHKHSVLVIFAAVVLMVLIAVVYIMEKNYSISDALGGKFGKKSQEQELIDANSDILKKAGDKGNLKPIARIGQDDHTRGDLKAPLHLIVYNDYQTEYGQALNESLKKAEIEYKDKLLIAFRHFPLTINPDSFEASVAVECAGAQDKFFEMHDRILADAADPKSIFGEERLMELAEEVSLDKERFIDCVENKEPKEYIQRQVDEAASSDVNGAPTLFVNSRSYAGAVPYDDFTDSAGEARTGLKNIIESFLSPIGSEQLTE